jgi:hypothetical protein
LSGEASRFFKKYFQKKVSKNQKLRQSKLQLIPPGKGRNMLQIKRKNNFCQAQRDTVSCDKVFSPKNSVIDSNRNVIELPGDVGSKSEKVPGNPVQIQKKLMRR